MTNVYTAARLRKGLPVPMKCTYNGMAVINAAPFQLHNLRFRWGAHAAARGESAEAQNMWAYTVASPPFDVPGRLHVAPVPLLWSHSLQVKCKSLLVTTRGSSPSHFHLMIIRAPWRVHVWWQHLMQALSCYLGFAGAHTCYTSCKRLQP